MLLLLDEVTVVDGWQTAIKALWDDGTLREDIVVFDTPALVENAVAIALQRRYEPLQLRMEGFDTPTRLHVWRTRAFPGHPAILVTTDELERRDDADLIPAHLFLWALG